MNVNVQNVLRSTGLTAPFTRDQLYEALALARALQELNIRPHGRHGSVRFREREPFCELSRGALESFNELMRAPKALLRVTASALHYEESSHVAHRKYKREISEFDNAEERVRDAHNERVRQRDDRITELEKSLSDQDKALREHREEIARLKFQLAEAQKPKKRGRPKKKSS